MIDRSKLSPDGEATMVEIEAHLMELCRQLKASLLGLGRPSRREQRRARKAAKNLVMYKSAGRRPWNKPLRYFQHDVLIHPIGVSYRAWSHHEMRIYSVNENHARIFYHLRERGGFLAMSRRAEQVAFEVAWLREQLAEFNRLSMSTLFDEATP